MADKNKQVAVVVGVGPGLGASLARRFAQGYAVAIMARRAEYLRSLGDEIRAGGGNVLEVAADVTNPVQIEASFKTIREKLGPPEILLYNAGGGTRGTVMELTLDQFESSWRANAFGGFLCVRQVVEAMIANGRGAMLFTGATAGMKAGPLSAAFGSAKFALRGLRRRWRAVSARAGSTSLGSTSMALSTSRDARAPSSKKRTC